MNQTHRMFRLLVPAFVLFLLASLFLWWPSQTTQGQIQAASKAIHPQIQLFSAPYSEQMAFDVLASAPQAQAVFANHEVDWVLATPLGSREARRWAEAGCWEATCAHVIAYNFDEGGTLEGVVNLENRTVVDVWQDRTIRPVASPHTLPLALAIAAQDKEVTAVLGDLAQAEVMMVPMNIWLLDNDCLTDWCVDLTFHDPAQTGQIFHVTVNLEAQEVARTFYTRGRENHPYRDITPQRNAFSNDCREQYGWEVCWEMTAHDGVNFYDASYDGQSIFSSAKIGQVEVWYPSWPGGYRDEIGHSASVPPYFDTVVEDLGDGFQVSQLFTEFTRWPNCICCYRYEQIMVFKEDGSFEANFISHGPGCDDLSVYQPMWRIDLDLGDPEGDEAYVWQTREWVEAEIEQEFELWPDVSPEGHKLATFDESAGLHYRWRYVPNDPLGLDEAKMFLVRWNEEEGDGPILTGPANTFEPPRQWLDDEPLSGENITVWYVPLMKTKKGGPWWCMPDPAPEMSPCDAVLRVEPAGALPTAEELAATVAAQEAALAEATPTSPPTAVPTPLVTSTPDETTLTGLDALEIMQNAGCLACHMLGDEGAGGKVGPDLTNIAAVAETRIPGFSAREYLRHAILYPNEFIVPECPNGPCLSGIMPTYYGERLTAGQLELVLDYLLEEREITGEEATPTAVSVGAEVTPSPTLPPAEEDNTAVAPSGWIGWLLAGLSLLMLALLWLATRRRST
jgi:mono/diheme cytochrome c family protein